MRPFPWTAPIYCVSWSAVWPWLPTGAAARRRERHGREPVWAGERGTLLRRGHGSASGGAPDARGRTQLRIGEARRGITELHRSTAHRREPGPVTRSEGTRARGPAPKAPRPAKAPPAPGRAVT